MSTAPQRTAGTRLLNAGFVAALLAHQVFWLGLPAFPLGVALVLAYVLWLVTPWHIAPRLGLVYGAAVLLLAGHAVEELVAGFPGEFPALFGREPWPEWRFVVFSGTWLVLFSLSAIALSRKSTPQVLRNSCVMLVFFMALAGGVGNGVVHLALSVSRGAYFPGTWTAVLCLPTGLWLLWLLYVPPRP